MIEVAKDMPAVSAAGAGVRVTVMPVFDTGTRVRCTVPHGLTLAEIIETALPGLPRASWKRLRIALVTSAGFAMVDYQVAGVVRPHDGVNVVLRVMPAGGAAKSIFSLLITLAATALTGPLASLLTVTSAFGKSLITAGLVAAGGILLNAIFKPKEDKERPSYMVSGWQNELKPDAPIVEVFGEMRYAPRFACFTRSEALGDRLFIRSAFLWGADEHEIDDIKIGETDISTYDECDVNTRLGLDDDEPLEFVRDQCIEESIGAALLKEKPRDDYGEPIDSEPAVSKPVTRTTASDTAAVGIIFHFPNGLSKYDKGGFLSEGGLVAKDLKILIEQRLLPAGDWETVKEIKFFEKKGKSFFRQHIWAVPVRGAYEIRVTRLDNNMESTEVNDDLDWLILQSFRPEYPFAYPRPLAMTEVYVRSTAQLNGTLDTLNAIVRKPMRDWDGEEWVKRATRNPAAHALHVLTGATGRYPAAAEEIDWPAFQDWHDHNVEHGLHYDRVHDFEGDCDEALRDIGNAGRAKVYWTGEKWTVTVDARRDIVIDHISARNAESFRWETTFFKPPDAIRVPFLDRNNDYKSAARLVPWPPDLRFGSKAAMEAALGHRADLTAEVTGDGVNDGYYRKTGPLGGGAWVKKDFTVVQEVEMPGKTDAAEIWIETRRLQYEQMLRSTKYTATKVSTLCVAMPGDLIMGARDVIVSQVQSGTVLRVDGQMISLDQAFEMEAGGEYAVQFGRILDDAPFYASTTRAVVTQAGEHAYLRLVGEGVLPEPGTIVHFGRAGKVSIPLIVTRVTRGRDNESVIEALPAADGLHDLVAAEVPPPWDGRVGTDIGPVPGKPADPKLSVLTGIGPTGSQNGLAAVLTPMRGGVKTVAFKVWHKLAAAPSFTGPIDVPAAGGSVDITGYSAGDSVTIEATAVSLYGVESDPVTITVTVGQGNPATPGALDEDSIQVTAKIGHVEIIFAPDDPNTTHVQVWRDGAKIGNPIAVSPGVTSGQIDGDSTRVNLLANADLTAAAPPPTLGTGWSAAAGKASHSATSGGALAWSGLTLSAGASYRFGLTIDSISGGSLTPRLTGGTTVSGTAETTAGHKIGALTAVSGNNTFSALASTNCVVQVDDLLLYRATPACVPQGTHTYELEPLNNGVAGPKSAPRVVTVA